MAYCNLLRRPVLLTGARDSALLGVAVSGLVAAGPMELFMPEAAAMRFHSYIWVLLAVYAKTNFGLPEYLYGWIPTTNAVMCVVVQFPVTYIVRRYRSLPVLAVGMAIYACGAGSVALMTSFPGFLTSMVILTFGELVVVPVASGHRQEWCVV